MKISETLTGRTLSDSHKDSIREGMNRFYSSPEGTETLLRRSERYSGGSPPRWKGGYTRNYGPYWSAVRGLIIIRDNHTCQGCGFRSENFSDLVVHHIDRDTLNEEDTNLITVCIGCNNRASRKEEEAYWEVFYKNRIEEIYKEVKDSDDAGVRY
jgi:5-methylcytosine-specific restriction endonuclease McrA